MQDHLSYDSNEAHPNRDSTIRRRSGSLDDDEISLIDVWNTLVRRRLIVGILFLATTAAGAVWLAVSSVNSEPEYEARATIRSALVANEPYDAPTGWSDGFVERHGLSELSSGPTMNLRIRGRSAETVDRDLSAAIEELLATQAAWHEIERETLQRRHDLAQLVFDHVDALLRNGVARETGTTEANDPRAITPEALIQLPELYERAAALERMMDETYTRPAEVIASVSVAEVRNNTRPTLVITLTLVLGAMIGVFGALFAEFVDNARKAREVENT